MGRHSQRHFAASLPGRSLRRRSPFAVAAALAAVAISTTAGAASLVTSPGTAPESASTAGVSAPAVTSVSGASASTPEEQAALDAASTELVRAEFLAGEGASRLTPDQLAQITATRDQLRQLVSAATTTDAAQASGAPTDSTADAATSTTLDAAGADDTLDGRDTFRASRAGSEGREALTTDGTAEAATDETPSEAALADAAAAGETTAAPAGDETASPAETPADAPAPEAPAAETPTTAEVVPSVAEIDAATTALRGLLDATAVAVAVEPAPPTAEEIAAQQAAERAAMAQQLAAWAASTAGYANGTIPANLLCAPSFAPGELVRCDAAYQLEQLNAAYVAAFGTNITVTSSYRSYASQVAVKAQKGFLAAAPGTSNHGMAQALDLGGGISSFGSAQYDWMRANAPAYGWENPEWARQGGSKPEPWHWEYGVTY
ncbi:M15 family metallopeptidase [Oerskovia enterophila]|uniref:M15 family metallopeptidase n=1 Tax=Oerskovia enterophila TaxID=43678 RepID=UPI00381BB170